MSDPVSNGDTYSDECRLNVWEQQVSHDVEATEAAHMQMLESEKIATQRRLWDVFQNTAQCVAVLYKGSLDQPGTLWGSFQTAAGSVTCLYKDALDGIRRNTDSAVQLGYQKRNKEVLHFLKRKRNYRREELLAFLVGKPVPTRSTHLRGSPRTRIALDRGPQYPSQQSPRPEENLETFRDALALTSRRRNSNYPPDLPNFITDEMARHKRSAPSPPHDVTMDSPQHKRCKYS